MKPSFFLFCLLTLFVAHSDPVAQDTYISGTPDAPRIRDTTAESGNAWLVTNNAMPLVSFQLETLKVAPLSTSQVAGAPSYSLPASSGGYPFELAKPEYYLGDTLIPPADVDWDKTYKAFLASGSSNFLFDPSNERVYTILGGTHAFTWVHNDGTTSETTYTIADYASNRPYRIYWTDSPYNGPTINLAGKFVRLYGPDFLIKPTYGEKVSTVGNTVVTNNSTVLSGVYVDDTAHVLFASGTLTGQFVLAYYETGTFEKILRIQVVEVCRPDVITQKGEIGRRLLPDGRGYGTIGLHPLVRNQDSSDDEGPYLYHHKGQYIHSPKNDYVFALRKSVGSENKAKAEIYWMETDPMQVDWPFELDQYENDWPADATVFVRGENSNDPGRPIFIPSDYSATLMNFQEPRGHAEAVSGDGIFSTRGNGYSLLKLVANDNIWFLPIHSVLRTDTDYFTLESSLWNVGSELRLRGGAIAGHTESFSPDCSDADVSPGYLYPGNSGPHYNHELYREPKPQSASSETSASDDSETYDSVIYAVNTDKNNPNLEVWWNTVIHEEDMTDPIEIPSLPQVYDIVFPDLESSHNIVIASQQGSANESIYLQNLALLLGSESATAPLARRAYITGDGGTLQFWINTSCVESTPGTYSVLRLETPDRFIHLFYEHSSDTEAPANYKLYVHGLQTPLHIEVPTSSKYLGWIPMAIDLTQSNLTLRAESNGQLVSQTTSTTNLVGLLNQMQSLCIGATNGSPTANQLELGEILLWDTFQPEALTTLAYTHHTGRENHLRGCYSFIDGVDLSSHSNSSERTTTDKVFGTSHTTYECFADVEGIPSRGTGILYTDGPAPTLYVQNDPSAEGYNPNEEHAFIRPSNDGGYVVWALRNDLNRDSSSQPGTLATFVHNGRKQMRWFGVVLTNEIYTSLAANATAGLALPGPHPLDYLPDPWMPETTWDEPAAIAPVHRDRKGQLWATSEGTLNVRMYYPMQEGFAFPEHEAQTPAIGKPVAWLSLLDKRNTKDPFVEPPAQWTWSIAWPKDIPEMPIAQTLTTATAGLPEVWNAKSIGIVYPKTQEDCDNTVRLIDPTVARTTGFATSDDPATGFKALSEAIPTLGITTGNGGKAFLRKGKYYFNDLPPSLSERFYLDTSAPLESCIKLIGQKEHNPGGVALLHVNILSTEERQTLSDLLEHPLWKKAIQNLATDPVIPNTLTSTATENTITYSPRDHYALLSVGATNYVTLIENDSTAPGMNIQDGDPIQMHILRVVPRYYTGRVVTRQDPLNLLSQQLSVLYEESFAGYEQDYEFEWRSAYPRTDGVVATNILESYTQRFPITPGKTHFVIGAQGDTLANMVNTYFSMRYRLKDSSPLYATSVMKDQWSDWTYPALAEGWVQRVLNNVTPFTQRMQDLYENEAETAVTMIRQAGAPYEGDIALNQENLPNVGLIQLYETILSKAEAMSLRLRTNDANANKQLQLAVGRLAELYNVLGDEAYADALNPTINIGAGEYIDDYENYASALFCFDNQVQSLLDEELALFRGRDGNNAPATTFSPVYNRLVWNFTRGLSRGELAYAVNYDISGIDTPALGYQQAATMFPQGHGDAYGHYLSSLSGYYRLLRNPYFSWGQPAMGEMVVADNVVNVDYFDEAMFAKSAVNVAKTALEVTDRTARKAYRDGNNASGAGYLDTDSSRNFGYGEWASRGGYGALVNWAVANSLVPETPTSGMYYRYAFDGAPDNTLQFAFPIEDAPDFSNPSQSWTLEAQLHPAPETRPTTANLFTLVYTNATLCLKLEPDNTLVLDSYARTYEPIVYTTYDYSYFYGTLVPVVYTNYVDGHSEPIIYTKLEFPDGASEWSPTAFTTLAITNGTSILRCSFNSFAEFPESIPESVSFDSAPTFPGWTCINETDVKITSEPSVLVHETPLDTLPLQTLPQGEYSHLVLSKDGSAIPTLALYNSAGQKLSETSLSSLDPIHFQQTLDALLIGGGYAGEISEIRLWDRIFTPAELTHNRPCVSAYADNLLAYFRPLSRYTNVPTLEDLVLTSPWTLHGGSWLSATQSTINVAFEAEGLNRIDRSTVKELSSLCSIANSLQTKVDQMDCGLNPLGLAASALPFDITPVGTESGEETHFEQIRARAGTAIDNARRILSRAQLMSNRLKMLEEKQQSRMGEVYTMEQEKKHALISFFGYPYEGDIGPGGTYPQGYDGPDLVHYACMDPSEYGLTDVQYTLPVTNITYCPIPSWSSFNPHDAQETILNSASKQEFTFYLSATGFILKDASLTGKRRANGKIQEDLGAFMVAYGNFLTAKDLYERKMSSLLTAMQKSTAAWDMSNIITGLKYAKTSSDIAIASATAVADTTLNFYDAADGTMQSIYELLKDSLPNIEGFGMTVNMDISSISSMSVAPGVAAEKKAYFLSELALKNIKVGLELGGKLAEAAQTLAEIKGEERDATDSAYDAFDEAWYEYFEAKGDFGTAYMELVNAQKAVESTIAEAERVLDERELERQGAVCDVAKDRYREMFYRQMRSTALTRYSESFELAQKYTWFAAQAYDYETGLLSSDPASSEQFLGQIIGARSLGEFDDDGNPVITSGDGDGGLADILARLDANWLVLKPRLGINNPQAYATWFSLRNELFRILPDEEGDEAWRTQLHKFWVDDITQLPEFNHYCQPPHTSSSLPIPEPGLVIPFSTEIFHGSNLFGEELAGGDSAFDSSWFATHIYSAGIHFEGYNEKINGYTGSKRALSATPTVYLVPMGDDRMRLPGQSTVVSWNIVDQTLPAPYPVGTTELDSPAWMPLFNGYTNGNDLGARIRKHPSFRASYGPREEAPSDDSLSCTRLIGRSVWNSRWLLIIPAGSLGANRDDALATFIQGIDLNRDGQRDISGVTDILLGFRTWSNSGN